MNRFNIFARPSGGANTSSNPQDLLDTDPYGDRTPLSPHAAPEILPDDLEAARPSAAAAAATHEMAERNRTTPGTRFLHRFRPTIPSFLSSSASQSQNPNRTSHLYGYGGYRPSSSHYSGDGLRGAPDTVVDLNMHTHTHTHMGMGVGVESPKSPEFAYRIGEGELNLPGTRLHLPNLARTWSVGENGPPTRPGTAAVNTSGGEGGGEGEEGVARPERAVHRSRRHGARERERDEESGRGHRERRRRRRGDGSSSGSGSGRSGRSGRSERSGSHRSHRSHRSRDEESGSGRTRRERRRREDGERSSTGRSSTGRRERRPPKHFLFCFPWIKSRRIRSQILRCFVSGMFLALTLSIYLSLSLTQHVTSNEFTILLILIILFVTIFFCHSLIRLCMLAVKARKREQAVAQGQLPEMAGPGGYAIPREPIPVVLARDEEAAGIESEATKTGPPAYGVWRESVRVDPNRLYWQRNEHVTVQEQEEVSDISSSSGSGSSQSSRSRTTTVPRPPSYSSDDGVSYVVDARPRSMAPQANGRLAGSSQASESGRSGPWI